MKDKIILIDTNILIRYFTNDVPDKAARCETMLKKVAEGKQQALLNDVVIAEIVWVLDGAFNYPREKITEILLRLVNTPHIIIPNKDIINLAFSYWKLHQYKIDYIDVYNAAWVSSKNLEGIYSYDFDFDRLKIPRFEP